jgi:hypothetical protein
MSHSHLAVVASLLTLPFRPLRSARRLNLARLVLHSSSPQQCRSITLIKLAKSKTLLGQHKILPFSHYTVPPVCKGKHLVNIVKDEKGTLLASDLTLEQVYQHYVKPGQLLYLTNAPTHAKKSIALMDKEKNIPNKHNNYALFPALSKVKITTVPPPKYVDDKQTRVLQQGPIKTIAMMVSTPAAHFSLILDKAYQFVKLGCAVEFHVRFGDLTLFVSLCLKEPNS